MWAWPEVIKGRGLKRTQTDKAHVDGWNDGGEGGEWHDSHVLALWEETGGRPHPEGVETPPRKTQNRESNSQPGELPQNKNQQEDFVFISV